MNRLFAVVLTSIFSLSLFAQPPLPPVLRVGIEAFAPPFATLGANNSASGFDVDMVQALCKLMQRPCLFFPVAFRDLINATAGGQLDMAVSAIAITVDRAKLVNFSLPYWRIEHRILTRKELADRTPYSLAAMSDKKVGYEEGTILAQIVNKLLEDPAIIDPKMISYHSIADEMLALSQGKVDFLITDNPTAIYWASNDANGFATFGPPILSNYYTGIALNPALPQLVTAVNQSLREYMLNGGYRENYNRYLVKQFS